jgi:hypothetical protein
MSINNILKSHYHNIDKVLSDVTSLCKGVKEIKPKSNRCQESYPCGGHGGAVIMCTDDIIHYPCTSVELGVIMYYYGIENHHFTEYVDSDMRKQIDKIRSK